jgi:hypothetical protein
MFLIYQQQIVACDLEIEQLLGGFDPRVNPDEKPSPPDRKRSGSGKNRRKKNTNPVRAHSAGRMLDFSHLSDEHLSATRTIAIVRVGKRISF